MNKEIKTMLKKTAKIAGVTCFAAGAVAVLTSVTALKAIAEGGKYLGETVKKILKEESDEKTIAETVAEPIVEEAAEAPAEEETE